MARVAYTPRPALRLVQMPKQVVGAKLEQALSEKMRKQTAWIVGRG
jgi:hypothetical protein